ncbi:MAG: phosphoenolpyruvate--protein phosphotransferase, partial [Rhodobacterales bacterium]|nr:phosphoenolpyruvate--protein phosphotransferase [Rhodobacterales bacterium]
MATRSQREQVFKGLGVSGGIGKGIVHLRESGALVVPEYTVPATKVADEQARLTRAVASALRQIGRLRHKARAINGAAGEELGYLLEAYHHMLKGSRLVRGAERRIAEERINAEAAVQAEVVGIAQQFADMQDAYMAARVADIREVGNRLLRSLTRAQDRPPAEMPKGAVVVAEELTPSDTALLDPTRVAGIATATGGAEGHTAIMARSLGLPAVLGAHGLLAQVRAGDRILLDGDAGTVVLNPTAETEAAYDRRRQSMLREKRRLARLRKQPAITRDGERVALLANMELPIELAQVSQSGAEGIGLLRSEFLFMNRPDVPGEDEQYDSLIPII